MLVQGRKAQVNDAASAAKTVYQYNDLKHRDLVKALAAQRAYNRCTWGHAHCSVKQLTALHNTLNGYRQKSKQNSQQLQAICQADSDSAACRQGIRELTSYAADVKHFDEQPQGPVTLAASPHNYDTRQALGFDDLALQKSFKTGLAKGQSPKQIVDDYQSRLAVHNDLVNAVGAVAVTVATEGLGEAVEGVSALSRASSLLRAGEGADSAVAEETGVWKAISEDVKVNRDTGLELNPKTGKWERSGENADITASEGSIDKGLAHELSEDGLGDDVGKRGLREADNIANGPKLAKQLTLESANSPFTKSGKLTDGAIKGSREIIPASSINNPAIPKGFSKYSTETFQSLSGNFQAHFYKNSKTGEVFYSKDYKVIFNSKSGG